MRLLWLADVLRSEGLSVVETSGWRLRGSEFSRPIIGVIGHHTASNRRSGNAPSLSTCIVGRPDLKGPLCQCLLGRDGSWIVIASGVGNHAGKGIWNGSTIGNDGRIGIEAENDGVGEPWPVRQMDSYVRGSAALLRHLDLSAASWCSHFEFARPTGRKIDPAGPWIGGGNWYSDGVPRSTWSARTFRDRITAYLEGEDDMFTDADRDLLERVEKKLDDFFGIDPATGAARDIRAKIDDTWTRVAAEDHRNLLAGRVAAIDRKTNPGEAP